jgi:carboxypeptidase Q
MTLSTDAFPHTGAMSYDKNVPKIPAAAVSTRDADVLSSLLRAHQHLRVRLKLSCRTLDDVPSANVIGEIVGTTNPREVIVIGGHLDAWDTGNGAHDDGSGCVQALEALHLLRHLGLKPRVTVRAVLFMNEENGLRGGRGYASDARRTGETHIAVLESDRGGFAPRGFFVTADSSVFRSVQRWRPLFKLIGATEFRLGGSGADVSPLVAKGIPGFGLYPENQRYFDYHHSAKDTIDKVNPRELELGAIAEALLVYLISEEGL